MFPGFGIAAVAFAGYCAYEAVFLGDGGHGHGGGGGHKEEVEGGGKEGGKV